MFFLGQHLDSFKKTFFVTFSTAARILAFQGRTSTLVQNITADKSHDVYRYGTIISSNAFRKELVNASSGISRQPSCKHTAEQ